MAKKTKKRLKTKEKKWDRPAESRPEKNASKKGKGKRQRTLRDVGSSNTDFDDLKILRSDPSAPLRLQAGGSNGNPNSSVGERPTEKPLRNASGKGPQAFLERISQQRGPQGGRPASEERRGGSERRVSPERRAPGERRQSDSQRSGDRDRDRGRGPFQAKNNSDPYALPESSPWSNKGRRHQRKQERDENRWQTEKGGNKKRRETTYDKKNRLESRPEGKESRAGVNVVQGEVQKNRKGFAFLLQRPEDIFIPAEYASHLLTGDIVKVWVDGRRREVIRLELVDRGIKSFIGTYSRQKNQHLVELRDRTMLEYVIVDAPSRTDAALRAIKDGHKVMVEVTEYEPYLKGRILQDFGPKLAPKFDTLAVVTRSQWPQEFSAQAQSQATEASRVIIQDATNALGTAGARRDLRDKHFVTIDGKDARDFDDAVYVEKTKSGFVLYVAIADVAEFVPEGSALDDEAFTRTTSVYFPDYVIPMLPEALSNGACSLKPNEDRLVVTCEMHFDLAGKKRSAKVYEGIINSKRRCIYEDVDAEAKNNEPFWESPYELYRLLKAIRIERGTIDLDLPEAKIILNEDGDTIDIRKAERLDAHRLIEEFMIVANESVTEIMEREAWPFVYRVHEPPGGEGLMRFERFAMALGLKLDMSEAVTPKRMSKFMEIILQHPLSQVLSYLLLRSLKQARYEAMNAGHFGLASTAYTHFTSPIRRYPDLMVHRILKRYARHQPFEGEGLEEFKDYLVEACDHCSKYERKADEIARTVDKVKRARFMANHLGETFAARVTNASAGGLFVELEKWFVDGMVPIDEIGEDYFEFNEEKIMLFGRRSGRKFKIGDRLQVTVLRCDVEQGYIDFTLQIPKDAVIEPV